jgi:hypothetical protein
MGIQSFLLKHALKSKLKGLPEAQQKVVMEMMEKNPTFFKKIGDEIEKRKKSGQNETQAAMQVMREHQADFQKLL